MSTGPGRGHEAGRPCPLCKAEFTLDELCTSAEVKPIGLLLDPEDPAYSLFFFNHLPTSCLTSFTLPIAAFAPLIREPIPSACLAFSPACEKRCDNVQDHQPCAQECRNAPYRRFLTEVLVARRGRGVF